MRFSRNLALRNLFDGLDANDILVFRAEEFRAARGLDFNGSRGYVDLRWLHVSTREWVLSSWPVCV